MDGSYNYVIDNSFELKPDVRELVDFDRDIAILLSENELRTLSLLAESSPDVVEQETLAEALNGSGDQLEGIISRLRTMMRDENARLIRGSAEEGYRIESVKKLAVSHNITGFAWPQTFLRRALIAMIIFIVIIVIYILVWGNG